MEVPFVRLDASLNDNESASNDMNTTHDLFDSAELLSWLPGETLFSLISRHHYFWGHQFAKDTNIYLFGRSRSGSQHDLPSCIDEFVRRTEHSFGSALEICTERTLLHYYKKFMNASEEARVVATLRGPTVSNLKFELGLLTSQFRAHHPLKACATCMSEDRETWGWAYWHLQHQYPGVWVCPIHSLPLQESNLKSSGVQRFLWHLPDETHFRPLPRVLKDLNHASLNDFSRLTQLTVGLIESDAAFRIDMAKLHRLYHAELAKRNLLTPQGGFRLREIAIDFMQHTQTLRLIPELSALPATVDEAYKQLSRHLRAPRTGTHPLRHVVMIDWLLGSHENFFRSYEQILPAFEPGVGLAPNCQRATPLPTIDQDNKKLKLAKRIQEDHRSVRAAAAELNIDTATAMVWAAQMGVTVSRRPKKLKLETRQALVAQLRQGAEKIDAAENFHISIGTVTHVLRTEIGLHAEWQHARYQAAQDAARASWSALVAKNATLGVKFIRNMNPGAYAWLYRNDRAWLTERSPTRNASAPERRPRVQWDERDLMLSHEVERAALVLRPTLGKKKLMLWHLYQEIPELKAKLSALDRLPRTVRAIEIALKRRDISRRQIDMLV
ncbi:homeo-like domain protein [Collimonas fungivorans]|uniref:Homeo-like domain protein n=1 Tax=Collimonas fungivorans TaxID=158899 RepID=A0A127P686_9BURK|nr:TnsD family Tn7-like transposition protein [Collimonas fungivorans]AMO93198.1 homeo-like domain protein [Collimonas fungivorans]